MENTQNNTLQDEYPLRVDDFTLKITTTSQQAQKWFDRALMQAYSFNHEETVLCCEKAIQLDPQCAMAYYLKSFALGINYNNAPEELEVDQVKQMYESWRQAAENSKNCQQIEIDLIQALKPRAGNGVDLKHAQNDQDFSAAMKLVYTKYCSDQELDDQYHAFISEIYAESLMNLRPWDLWVQKSEGERKYGDPYENTLEIKKVLETGLSKDSNHSGLRHLWIHLMELSPYPEQALCSNFTQTLSSIRPDSGHLCHMPSHVEILCGQYEKAMESNLKGIKSDEKYYEYRTKQGLPEECFYTLYRCHNIHFLAFAGMFAGIFKPCYEASKQLIKICNQKILEDTSFFCPSGADWLESFIQVRIHVLIRYGKWEELIQEPYGEDLKMEQILKNQDLYCSTLTAYYYGQGIAYAVLAGKHQSKKDEYLQKAEEAQKNFLESLQKIPNSRTIFNNKMVDIFQIGREMLAGELFYRQEKYEQAFEHLKKAVYLDDNLPYDEPWGWMVPSRHALGALLLEHGAHNKNTEYIKQAEQIYKTDLGEGVSRAVAHPDNIWSLIGLNQSLKLQGKSEYGLEDKIQDKLKISDININASCLCSLKEISF